MVTVIYLEQHDGYVVKRRGATVSHHRKASAAKRAGKQLGKRHGEPVSYQGPRGGTKFIYTPDPEEQFGAFNF